MPYDNNLSAQGDTIISMLKSGLINDNVTVVIQADFLDTLGMKRYILKKDTIIEENYSNEKSASTNSLRDYLKWVSDNFNPNNTALIFLNHGGGLDELCYDESPEFGFLKIDSIKTVTTEFNGRTKKKIDLLFLQVCAKGSIEAVYELKDCANYTMFSQVLLGAPNYYYKNTLKYVSNNSKLKAYNIAKQIAKNEREDMYGAYICIENSKFDSLKVLFNDFIYSLEKKDKIALKNKSILKYDYYSVQYWDLRSFLNNLNLDENSQLKKDVLLNFISNDLIIFNITNPQYERMKKYLGLSIFAFSNNDYLDSYKNLQLFEDIKLKGIYKRVYFKK